MAYHIDCTGAGKDIEACKEGTRRFQDEHPDLDWEIAAGQSAGQLHLAVLTPGGHTQLVPVLPRLDMADSIFTALEEVFRSK